MKNKILKNIQTAWYDFSWIFIRKYKQIKRVIDFMPIIWNGFDFDYNYSLELFKHQLKRTADFLESDKAMTMEAKFNAGRIRTALRLMDKVYGDDTYDMEYMDIMEQLYGKHNYKFVKIDRKSKDGQDLYEMVSWYENEVDAAHREDIAKVEEQMMLQSRLKQKKAERILWNFIAHNIRSWWD
jgi:hypothetical protein